MMLLRRWRSENLFVFFQRLLQAFHEGPQGRERLSAATKREGGLLAADHLANSVAGYPNRLGFEAVPQRAL
jgi:hypothetical protein